MAAKTPSEVLRAGLALLPRQGALAAAQRLKEKAAANAIFYAKTPLSAPTRQNQRRAALKAIVKPRERLARKEAAAAELAAHRKLRRAIAAAGTGATA